MTFPLPAPRHQGPGFFSVGVDDPVSSDRVTEIMTAVTRYLGFNTTPLGPANRPYAMYLDGHGGHPEMPRIHHLVMLRVSLGLANLGVMIRGARSGSTCPAGLVASRASRWPVLWAPSTAHVRWGHAVTASSMSVNPPALLGYRWSTTTSSPSSTAMVFDALFGPRQR